MAHLSDDDMRQLLTEFLTETQEGLGTIEEDLVRLEQDPTDRSLLESIFRTMHTIKGSAGFLDLRKLESIAHVTEDILTRAMEGQLFLTPASVTVLLEAIDAITAIVASLAAGEGQGDEEYAHLKRRLKVINESCGHKTTKITQIIPAPNAPEQSNEQDAAEAALEASQGEVWDLFGDDDDEEEEKQAEESTTDAAHNTINTQAARTNSASQLSDELEAAAQATPAPVAPPPPAPAPTPAKAQPEPAAAKAIAPAKVESTIRIDVNLLEKLMNLVGELVLSRNQLLQYSETIDDPTYLSIVHRASLVTSELQENVMKARMQPIGTVFAKIPRIVRDLSLGQGKKIKLLIEGEDTELDRTIHEGIKDPLVHLIRNACDHGVETPDVRSAAGKPEEGIVRISAYHEGGHVNIDIAEDGAGIDVEKVKAKAIEKGVVSAQQAATLSDKEARELIFLPGFSTAAQVTNVSGRGVGMDVVKTHVEKIGGMIEIDSELGRGTTFKIKIPLTLAIIPALVVRASHERFAIPQIALRELVRIEEDSARQIENIQGSEVLRLRGKLLPLVRLCDILKLESTPAEAGVENVVVLNTGTREIGLLVDAVNDVEEIVVKPLSRQLKNLKYFAGSTIMGDGRVALIVDTAGIGAACGSEHDDLDQMAKESAERDSRDSGDFANDEQSVLLFSLGVDDRFAIPLNLVSRLEEFEEREIEKVDGKLVAQYRGQILPLVDAAKHFQVTPATEFANEKRNVVVFEVEGRSVGVLVNEIVDVVEAQIAGQDSAANRRGVAGSSIIHDRTTLLLDVFGLFEMEDSSLLRSRAKVTLSHDARQASILIVDDSQFFRVMIEGYLRGAGHRVHVAIGGEEALDILERESIDLIVSDLDMPNMDGLAFMRKVRAQSGSADIPSIACSSLTDPNIPGQSLAAGFSSHILKLNQDELLGVVAELLEAQRVEA